MAKLFLGSLQVSELLEQLKDDVSKILDETQQFINNKDIF